MKYKRSDWWHQLPATKQTAFKNLNDLCREYAAEGGQWDEDFFHAAMGIADLLEIVCIMHKEGRR